MDRNEFLSALRGRLAALPEAEIRRSTDYYEEMISDYMEEGMSEAQAVALLEPVEVIAAKILADAPVKTSRGRKAMAIVLIALGSPIWLSLMIALAAVAVSVYATIWAVVLSIWAAVISLVGGGLLAAVAGPFQAASQGAFGWYTMGAGLIMAGAGLLLIWPSALFTRWIGKGTCSALRWMWKKLFVRRKRT